MTSFSSLHNFEVRHLRCVIHITKLYSRRLKDKTQLCIILYLLFMSQCFVTIFWYIIPTRCTGHRVYLILQLLYMFRVSLSPIFRSTKQL